ncbi:MAG: hypothetical protein KZQ99_06660 [Candidatus Thiodiazotropha sp. (ex Dulcina madagascariensis)]|nr:hypothetical protein [Candidatus Thiodiazotropha sp. (ex Dulcina madagascariensis)]
MEKQINLTKQILLVAGIIEIAVGLLHFAMPSFAYQAKGFSLLEPNEINFVTLVVFAVGILLVAFGAITILFSRKLESMVEVLYYYVVIKTILWAGRVILELIYPVNLSMFYVEPFTLVVLPGLIIELLLFVVSVVLIRKIVVAKNV